jgi:carboxylate-amine ligase
MDTGFASARVKIRDASPRSGLPPTFRGWEEFEDYTEALVDMGNIPDFSWFWWDVRPHLRHGTVELRVPDVQAEPDYVARDPARPRRPVLRLRHEKGERGSRDGP